MITAIQQPDIVTAAGVTEFPEICPVATQRKAGYEFYIRGND
jgi:hypothetical protein